MLCRTHQPQYSSITTSRMTVSTVSKTQRAKLPVVSTANKINAITTVKTRVNNSGEVVATVKTKEPRIKTGVQVYPTKNQLKSLVKQGDLLHDTIQTMENSFQFYGVVIKADAKKGWWHVDYDMFLLNGKSLRISRNMCCTIPEGQDEPVHEFRNERVDAAIANLETLESDPDEDVELAVEESYDDENRGRVSKTKKKQKKKTRKVLSLESFIGMSDDGVLQAKTFDHYFLETTMQIIFTGMF